LRPVLVFLRLGLADEFGGFVAAGLLLLKPGLHGAQFGIELQGLVEFGFRLFARIPAFQEPCVEARFVVTDGLYVVHAILASPLNDTRRPHPSKWREDARIFPLSLGGGPDGAGVLCASAFCR